MSHSLLDQFVVVLVEPQNPINVGNVMRAMKNMGLSHLYLVNPAPMDLSRTQISAHRTQDYLENLKIFPTLDEALEGMHQSYGFSARERSQSWVSLPLSEAATAALAEAGNGARNALVFGREQTGLTNAELERCTRHVRIPTTDYASLNLSQAVMCAAYELSVQAAGGRNICSEKVEKKAFSSMPSDKGAESEPATLDQQMRLVKLTADMLSQIGFFKSRSPNSALHKIHKIITRSELREDEFHLLMGVCREVFNYAELVKRGIFPENISPDPTFRIPEEWQAELDGHSQNQ